MADKFDQYRKVARETVDPEARAAMSWCAAAGRTGRNMGETIQ